mmetsp:Transcript_116801/g.363694  ORF Transcript_116801/g.363694 Transcript_116801/m.363694 type:complete len:116 (+) Transcript_116801:65-412(+)
MACLSRILPAERRRIIPLSPVQENGEANIQDEDKEGIPPDTDTIADNVKAKIHEEDKEGIPQSLKPAKRKKTNRVICFLNSLHDAGVVCVFVWVLLACVYSSPPSLACLLDGLIV